MAPPKTNIGPCSVAGCDARAKYRGMCGKHYKRMWRHGSPLAVQLVQHTPDSICIVEGCGYRTEKSAYCMRHYQMLKHRGSTEDLKARNGESRYIDANGYVRIGSKTYEHIAVAERVLGKPLPPGAVVHHINQDRTDNRPENLVICPSHAYHRLIHHRMEKLGISLRDLRAPK